VFNSSGHIFKLTASGESHGKAIGGVVEGRKILRLCGRWVIYGGHFVYDMEYFHQRKIFGSI
jgi:hypothetical protein